MEVGEVESIGGSYLGTYLDSPSPGEGASRPLDSSEHIVRDKCLTFIVFFLVNTDCCASELT